MWTFQLFFAYLLGSIPFGLILTRCFSDIDIRSTGSGNIGATNVLRTSTKTLGILTLLLDAGKGALSVCLPFLFGFSAPECSVWGISVSFPMLLGAMSVFAHIYPIWLAFKGGKGIATAFGVTLALSPWLGGALLLTWGLCAYLWRTSSLSALITFTLAPLIAFFIDASLIPLMGIFALLFIWTHRLNIQRLLKAEEASF